MNIRTELSEEKWWIIFKVLVLYPREWEAHEMKENLEKDQFEWSDVGTVPLWDTTTQSKLWRVIEYDFTTLYEGTPWLLS